MGSKQYEEDPDLEATLGITDRVFGDFDLMYWQNLSVSVPHCAWRGHIHLYHAWDIFKRVEPLPDDTKELLRVEPPPTPIPADCSLVIGLVLGIKLHVDNPSVVDKR